MKHLTLLAKLLRLHRGQTQSPDRSPPPPLGALLLAEEARGARQSAMLARGLNTLELSPSGCRVILVASLMQPIMATV